MPRIPAGRASGFTLLEMLVALTVFGFLMVGLNAGMHSGLRLWGAQNRLVGDTASLDSTARILRNLLTGIPINPAAAGNVAIAFSGKADRLSFVGDLPTGLGDTQRADITLSLHDGRLVLQWSPHRHERGGPAPPASQTELMRRIERLQLAYWGVPSPGAVAGWLAKWDGPALPELVRVRLILDKGDNRRWPDLIAAPQLSTPPG